jgi:hypothetical protein
MSEDNKKPVVKASQTNSSSITTSVPTSGPGNQIMGSSTGTANVPNLGKTTSMPLNTSKTVTFSLTQVKTEPKINSTQTLPKNSNSESTTAKASTATAIRLQIDSLGE